MSAANRIKVVSAPLPPPAGCSYPEGSSLRVVSRTQRRAGDFYETPGWVVDAVLPHLPLSSASLVVDAGAGTGAIAERIARSFPKLEIIGVEVNAEHVAAARAKGIDAAEFVVADFETWQSERSAPDVIIMNPPYSHALQFVRRAQQIVRRGGYVVALLRLGFLCSAKRSDFHKKHPARVLPLDKRPSFTGDGCTDASDYAWFIWTPEVADRGTYEVLQIPRTKRATKRRKR